MQDIKQCHPRLQELAARLMKECDGQGIKIAIGECLRTVAEQDALYAQGRTAPGSIVTNAPGSTYNSMHQWGIAMDFYLATDVDGDGRTSDDSFNNDTQLFDKVGQIGKKLGLEWGGDWKSIQDRPHFQLPDWGSTPSELKGRYKMPDAFRKTWEAANIKPARPTKTVTVKSPKGEVLWLQSKANIVISRTGLKDSGGSRLVKLAEDGEYGARSQAFVRAYWLLLGWENRDNVGNAGTETIAALEIWR